MKTQRTALVIGGGLAGLSAAIRLQFAGIQTTLLEKNHEVGGKLHEVTLGTHRFDFGPNTITMPHVFQSVLEKVHENPDDYFEFIKLETHTKNVFSDGSHLFFSSNQQLMTEELARLDPQSAKKYAAYLKEVKKLYHLSNKHFLHRTFSSWKDYLSLPLAKAMASARPLQSLDQFHRSFFKDERIIRAFNRYATYIGSSPYTAPATFGLIGHLEMGDGVYYTKGGNHQIALGFKKAAKKLGVRIVCNEEVVKGYSSNNKLDSVETKSGGHYKADVFVLNGDLLTQYPRLIQESDRPSMSNKKVNQFEPSISAFVTLAASSKRHDLHHHHVFFGDDPREEFQDIFQYGTYGKDPTIYVCTSSKTDPSMSPDGDNLFILVNAPPLKKEVQRSMDLKSMEQKLYQQLDKKGLSIQSNIVASKIVDPQMMQDHYYAFRGALYGVASNKRKDTFLRPFNRSQDLGNLYFAGGSTHPGGGSPMVVLSGQNVAEKIVQAYKQ
ncbi:phytoene desaturase [Salipaludibacillus keqinensis]|uniref:4,4'-diaponeurosporene oxygenase n=1 Tax=Salipaludibacillus keqinensis TaxID=2045207 RepID=A0A323TXR0_9BACI|nr:phytoene desaturase family protein [Salipaludibacillus keqinensis]PYZ94415.1 phytoene desaturase [Salipaludibacillus keqinensis]